MVEIKGPRQTSIAVRHVEVASPREVFDRLAFSFSALRRLIQGIVIRGVKVVLTHCWRHAEVIGRISVQTLVQSDAVVDLELGFLPFILPNNRR